MLVDGDRASGQTVAKARFVDLPTAIRNGNRVVLAHDSLRLDAEHPIQILPATTSKCGTLLLRGDGKLAVEFGEVTGAEKRIGRFRRSDLG